MVGGNVEVVWLSGVDVKWIEIVVYVIVGSLLGLVGFLLMVWFNLVEVVGGIGYELWVIVFVVIGGVSLVGGVGGIGGMLMGVLLIGVLFNGFVMMGVNVYY